MAYNRDLKPSGVRIAALGGSISGRVRTVGRRTGRKRNLRERSIRSIGR